MSARKKREKHVHPLTLGLFSYNVGNVGSSKRGRKFPQETKTSDSEPDKRPEESHRAEETKSADTKRVSSKRTSSKRASSKRAHGSERLPNLFAIMGYDEQLAEIYLKLRFKGYRFKWFDLSDKSTLQELHDELLKPRLFSKSEDAELILIKLSSVPAKLKRSADELLENIVNAVNSGKTIVLWLVSSKWVYRAEVIGDKLVQFIDKNANKFILETPRRRLDPVSKLDILLELKGIKVDEETKYMILDMYGDDLGMLSDLLDKMAVFITEGYIPTRDELSAMVSLGTTQNLVDPFEFSEAFLSGDWTRWIRYIRSLRRAQADFASYLALLLSQIYISIRLKVFMDEGYSLNESASMLGIHRFRAVKLLEVIKRSQLELEQLVRDLVELSNVELSVKSGRGEYYDLLLKIAFNKVVYSQKDKEE